MLNEQAFDNLLETDPELKRIFREEELKQEIRELQDEVTTFQSYLLYGSGGRSSGEIRKCLRLTQGMLTEAKHKLMEMNK